HHEISATVCNMRLDRRLHVDAAGGDALDRNLAAVAGEMAAHIGAGDLAAPITLAGHDDELDHLGAFEERHRVSNGARSWTTAVPAYDHAIELEAGLLDMGHDDHRASGLEQRTLDHEFLRGAVARLCLPDHGDVEAPGDAAKH